MPSLRRYIDFTPSRQSIIRMEECGYLAAANGATLHATPFRSPMCGRMTYERALLAEAFERGFRMYQREMVE